MGKQATEDGYRRRSTKSLHTILQERGINTATMRADDMCVVLSNHDDFLNEKTIVKHFLHERGHLALFCQVPL